MIFCQYYAFLFYFSYVLYEIIRMRKVRYIVLVIVSNSLQQRLLILPMKYMGGSLCILRKFFNCNITPWWFNNMCHSFFNRINDIQLVQKQTIIWLITVTSAAQQQQQQQKVTVAQNVRSEEETKMKIEEQPNLRRQILEDVLGDR